MATKKDSEISLKLLIDTKSRRVLFAEAGKDAVDFLFSLLSIPMGSIVKLLTMEQMVGSISSIYRSIENLDETYMESNQAKSLILNPTFASPPNTLFLPGSSSTSTGGKYYRCSNRTHTSYYYTASPSILARATTLTRHLLAVLSRNCNCQMNLELTYVGPNSGGAAKAAAYTGGIVKGGVTYTIMDDLSVMPMSTISSITLLNKFNVRDVALLEERTVKLGMKEGLELLKASLQSKTVLTDVFGGMKPRKKARNLG